MIVFSAELSNYFLISQGTASVAQALLTEDEEFNISLITTNPL